MCGIMGYVRTGEQTVMTWPVVKQTYAAISVRGRDAAGFGVMNREENKVLVAKAAITSIQMAGRKDFKKAANMGDIIIGHSRAATSGDPSDNENNHPFWTDDGRYVLIHNGVIRDNPEDLETESECDSEIALRMVERHGVYDAACRMAEWPNSDYALMVLDRKEKSLFVWRNEWRPCAFVKAHTHLGGYLLASTATILNMVLRVNKISTDAKILDTRPHTLYRFGIGEGSVDRIRLPEYDLWQSEMLGKPGLFQGDVVWTRGER